MPEQIKDVLRRLVAWAKLKARIQVEAPKPVYFSDREVWWAHLGENIGSEQNGRNALFERPVLIVKKFNADLLWVLPLTTTDRNGPHYFMTSYEVGQKPAKVVLSQLRSISSKRLIRKQRVLAEREFEEVLKRLRKFLL